MTNQPWQEEIYIKSQNEDYANELIKMVSELSKEQYTAGYKAGREDCVKEMCEFIKNPKNGKEELQTKPTNE